MDKEIEKLFYSIKKNERLTLLKKISEDNALNSEVVNFCNAFTLYINNSNAEAYELIKTYESLESTILKGIVLSKLKKNDEAEQYFKLSIKKDEKFSYSFYGLGILYKEQEKFNEAEQCFKQSIAINENFPAPYNALGNLYFQLKKYNEAEYYYKLSIEKDENFQAPYYGLGCLFRELKKYGEAEKYYKLSIEKDGDFSNPYNGLGNLFSDLKNYTEAEKYYKLGLEKNENLSAVYYNLGLLYKTLNNIEEAEKCYKRSIEEDEDYADAYNNLGVLYSNLKNYEEAEKNYKLCIEKRPKNATVYSNLGIFYRDRKEYDKSLDILRKGLELLAKNKPLDSENYLQSKFENLIAQVTSAKEIDESYTEIQEISEYDPIKKILKEIKDNNIDECTFLNKKKFLKFIKPKQVKSPDDYFKVLRRWNSYTPIIADNYHISKGGGYFLKYNDLGIVIDPGFNFIENFKGADHVFDEIDAVFISHAHNDHTSDLESILTLLYKYNEEIKDSDDFDNTDTIRHQLAKERDIDYKDITREEINKEFLISEKRKTIDIFMTASTFKKYAGLFELYNKTDYKIHLVEADGKFDFKNLQVKVLKARHHDIISDYFSVGFVFYLSDTVIIYTGDTGWNLDIEKQYKDLAKRTKTKYKILVAHIGGFKEYEDLYLNKGYQGYEAFYKNHLGRLGIGKINETLQPDVCLISEFGEEIKGSRIKLCEIYEEAYNGKFKKDIKFFPADIGFTINLKNKKIMGVSTINLDKDELKYEYIEQSEIKIAELRKDYSLNYYKKESNFTESILIQILAEKYDESRK